MTAPPPEIKLNNLQKFDQYFEGKENLICWMSMLLPLLLGLLLFEPKVSIGGDDSIYINRAFNFIYNNKFPTFQGPLYPMVLGVIIYVFGVNLILLKFFSLLCLLAHQWLTFQLFRRYLSPFMLFALMILISMSAAILYYGSATYNESFYMLLQSAFLLYFEKSFIRNKDKKFDLKKDYIKILVCALLLFLLAIAKNVGLMAMIAVVIYFLFTNSWKKAAFVVVAFAIIMFSFNLIKTSVWDIKEAQISNQGSTLMLKNPYRPDQGKEDFKGFVTRFKSNCNAYIGFHFVNVFGLSAKDNYKGSPAIAILVCALFTLGFFIFFKKSKFWLFIGVFTGVAYGTTFLALQAYWNQERLIIIFVPILLAFILHLFHHLATHRLQKYANIFIAVIAIMGAATLFRNFTTIPAQTKVISKYLAGDKYYGFNEDWVHYLEMAKWAKDNLPTDAYIACRKPGMAFIYSGGKDFYGIWKVPSQDPKELYDKLKDAGVTHVIMANIRTNPDDPNSRIINTVRRYLSLVNKAYPGKLKLVHQIGDQWPAYLYELQ